MIISIVNQSVFSSFFNSCYWRSNSARMTILFIASADSDLTGVLIMRNDNSADPNGHNVGMLGALLPLISGWYRQPSLSPPWYDNTVPAPPMVSRGFRAAVRA